MSFKLCREKGRDCKWTQLNEDFTLKELNIRHNDTLYISRDITLVIKHPEYNEEDYVLDIKISSTISKLHEMVTERYGIYDIPLRLIRKNNNNSVLDNFDCTIEEYEICDNEIFYLQLGHGWIGSILGSKQCFYDLLSQQDIVHENAFSNEVMTNMQKQWKNTHNQSFKMVAAFRINRNFKRNMDIYNALISTRKSSDDKGIKERILFHGTSLKNLKSIIVNGFNRDHNIRSVYGKGTYFTNLVNIAADYCQAFGPANQFKAMLMCKVYVGDSTVGRIDMNESALYRSDKVTQYDSLVDSLYNPKVFVINRDYHAIPCQVIVFTF